MVPDFSDTLQLFDLLFEQINRFPANRKQTLGF